MPKTAMDYSKCCIYKIEHIDDESLVYVGHTTNFKQRKSNHKGNCYNEKGKSFNIKLYKMIRETGGWEMFKMIEVEKFPCDNNREAERRENEVMKELKSNMNTYRSHITNEELKLLKQVCDKKYREVNIDEIKEKKNIYRANNKDKIKEHDKKYYEENKLTLNEFRKVYYTANKNKIIEKASKYYIINKDRILEQRKETITCECGCKVVKTNLKRHQNTNKHIDLMIKISP